MENRSTIWFHYSDPKPNKHLLAKPVELEMSENGNVRPHVCLYVCTLRVNFWTVGEVLRSQYRVTEGFTS